MKTKTSLALLAVVLAFALVAAKEPPRPVVEVGKSYVISNGSAAVKGRIVSEVGAGWFRVLRSDGQGEQSVNVGAAFIVYEVTK